MKEKMQSIELQIHELMPPGCSCNMEEKVKNKVEGVHSAIINPNSNTMVVEFNPNKTNEEKIIGFMKKCGYDCSVMKIGHSEMKHKGHEMKDHKNHHSMMAKEFKIKTLKASKFQAIHGKGAKAIVEREDVSVGNDALMSYLKIDTSQNKKQLEKLSSQGKTVIYVSTKKAVKGLIGLSDIIRPESYKTVRVLRSLGIKIAMLTGYNKITAQYVAKELDLDTFFAEVLPGDKSSKVKELQSQGFKVAMAGDGVNDAPALTQADIGIAIGAGTDVAVESAKVVLVKNDPTDIAKLVQLSKGTMKKMKQNLAWATGYNAIAIPIAAGILFPYWITLKPEYAALIMAASSIIVVVNALMFKRIQLSRRED